MLYNRREAAKLGLAALGFRLSAFSQTKPNSKWAGVQVGLNAPYNFGGRTMTAGEIIERSVRLGVMALELRSQPVEEFLGSPDKSVYSEPVPEQIAARKATAEEIRKWRAAASMDKVRQCRQKFHDAGVAIEIMKVDE